MVKTNRGKLGKMHLACSTKKENLLSGKTEEKMTFDFDDIELEKIRKDEITGVVIQPNLPDAHGDVFDSQEVEEACRIWNEKFQHFTISHRDKKSRLIDLEALTNPETFENCFDQDFEILSSFVTDSQSVLNGESIPEKSWVISLKVKSPEIFSLIKEKKLGGFSIGALGIRNENGFTRISNLIVPELSLVQNPANRRKFLEIKEN